MNLVDVSQGACISGIDVPREFYWVLTEPTPLGGMKYPRSGFPWAILKAAGFSKVISLHPGAYDPAPLTIAFKECLADLSCCDMPCNESNEVTKIKRAVDAAVNAWRSGHGVVVHCIGGRGRSGTVLGCVLREIGFSSIETIAFLDRMHKARGRPGWPESPWQVLLVENWNAGSFTAGLLSPDM